MVFDVSEKATASDEHFCKISTVDDADVEFSSPTTLQSVIVRLISSIFNL